MNALLLVASLLLGFQPASCLTVALSSSSSTNQPTTSAIDAVKVVWFRNHALRVRDNDALHDAVKDSLGALSGPTGVDTNHSNDNKAVVVPVYLWSSSSSTDETSDDSPVDVITGGTASDVFLANALNSLNQTLFGRLSVGLLIENVQPELCADELATICKNSGAFEIYYMESYDQEFETALREELTLRGIVPRSFRGGHSLMDYSRDKEFPPWKEIISEHPFRSPLIPFVDYLLRRLEQTPPASPKPEPKGLKETVETPNHRMVTKPISVDDLLDTVGCTKTRTDWGSSVARAWPATEIDAMHVLQSFLDSLPPSSKREVVGEEDQSAAKRTHLASRLSPYLARGLLSPRQVYHALASSSVDCAKKDLASFVRRICWRDYTYAVASLFPDVTLGHPIREGYYLDENDRDDETHNSNKNDKQILFELWKNGATGFPLIDAGMRQLTKEGWMPQKVRLAASTCLVEGLGISWEEGMQHFVEYLVDYDAAINSNMWMNAGCVGFDPYYVGTDYKRRPYWDKDGDYVRQWCPELKDLPDSCEIAEAQRGIGTFNVDCLYEPWSAPENVLTTAGVILGKTYPKRCCDERNERKRFFEKIRQIRAQWPSSKTDERGRDMVRLGRDSKSESIGMFTPRAFIVGKSRK